jgi:hypothetical protein
MNNPSRSACSASAPSAAAPSRCCSRNQEEIRRRAGRGIEITMVADLDTERAAGGR